MISKRSFLPLPSHFSPPASAAIHLFFTTRKGGVSQGVFSAFNLGLHVPDDPHHVLTNRRLIKTHLQTLFDPVMGMANPEMIFVQQVHSNQALKVDAHFPRQENPTQIPPEADAMITTETGLLLSILTADCVPILLYDAHQPQNRVVAAIHAGWRGTLAGVIDTTITKMKKAGAKANTIVAVIGPAIQAKNYQVGAEVYQAFKTQPAFKTVIDQLFLYDHGAQFTASTTHKKERWYFNLPKAVVFSLRQNDILDDNIHNVDLCTFENSDLFFSHRRASQQQKHSCGRMLAGIIIQ
ncbi:peptidoglycan editing factor PgeF [Magnetococcales bacterium HHB-1]